MPFSPINFRQALSASVLGTALLSGSIGQSDEMIPRALLVDMARNQFSILCNSEAFASCMGFTTELCMALSEQAISQCLLPLPKEISPEKLENSALESCPKGVYAGAGFSEEKADVCFDRAMEVEPKG
ncbi:MAG: hypothetical protein ACI9UN_000485 [Granulosicoccus sp.]|jgi:hypothetical protein